jgi:hypothetical protein
MTSVEAFFMKWTLTILPLLDFYNEDGQAVEVQPLKVSMIFLRGRNCQTATQ